MLRHKKVFEDKERILLNTFDALKKLTDMKESRDQRKNQTTDDETSPSSTMITIDVTGEELNGGSTSTGFACKDCNLYSEIIN